MFAGHHHLDNLFMILDYNHMQALGKTSETMVLDPLVDKWQSFGWSAREGDGHKFDEIFGAFKEMPFKTGRPSIFIANTVKGKGVSFMENVAKWHHGVPSESELKQALAELDAAEKRLQEAVV